MSARHIHILTVDELDLVNYCFAKLVGMRLVEMWRYGEIQCFIFEAEDKASVCDLCAFQRWRLVGPKGFLLSNWHIPDSGKRRDTHAHAFYESLDGARIDVTGCAINDHGDIFLDCTSGYHLTIPCTELSAGWRTQWRLSLGQSVSLHLEGNGLYVGLDIEDLINLVYGVADGPAIINGAFPQGIQPRKVRRNLTREIEALAQETVNQVIPTRIATGSLDEEREYWLNAISRLGSHLIVT